MIFNFSKYKARKLAKRLKCDLCISNLKSYNNETRNEAKLLNLKSRGYLTIPDQNLFSILKLLECCFAEHATSQSVFEDTFEEFFKINKLSLKFPRADHKSQVMSDLFTYYIVVSE